MDNRPPVNVRFYRPGDEEGILHVLQASFPRWPEVETNAAPIDHLRWKLAGAEHPELNHIVAEASGEIIAVRIGLEQRYRTRGRTLGCRFDVDTAVLPAHQGRGVYSRMASFGVAMATNADAVFANTGRPSLLELDRGLGHQPLKNRLASLICDLPVARPRDGGDDRFEVREATAFDERIESFWAEAAAHFDFIAALSMDNLNLRYCDARGGIGSVLLAEERSDILGFVALRVSRGKSSIAYLLALPDRLDVVRSLAAAALSRFRDAGVSEVICALPRRHPYRSVLAEQGFTRKGHAIPFTCRPNAPDIDLSLLQEPKAAVHLMLGDTDLV
jgi:GNAT superfamily N-acetyltransferase